MLVQFSFGDFNSFCYLLSWHLIFSSSCKLCCQKARLEHLENVRKERRRKKCHISMFFISLIYQDNSASEPRTSIGRKYDYRIACGRKIPIPKPGLCKVQGANVTEVSGLVRQLSPLRARSDGAHHQYEVILVVWHEVFCELVWGNILSRVFAASL